MKLKSKCGNCAALMSPVFKWDKYWCRLGYPIKELPCKVVGLPIPMIISTPTVPCPKPRTFKELKLLPKYNEK
jgi:hypothetical protein